MSAKHDERMGQLMTLHKEDLARMVAALEHQAGVLEARIAEVHAQRPQPEKPKRATVTPPVRVVPREFAMTPRKK